MGTDDISLTRQYAIAFVTSVLILVSCSTVEVEVDEILMDDNLKASSEYFVVFGDIQDYITYSEKLPYYKRSLAWIQEQHKAGANITDILEVGDVTWENNKTQWETFVNSTKDIAEVLPYFTCTGNHDYTWHENSKIHDRASTMINDYAHFPLTDSRIIEYYSGNSLENYVAQLSNKKKTKLLVLEFGPRKEVVQWAKEYVEAHPSDHFILMTHEWLTRVGNRLSGYSYAEMQFTGYSSFSTPEEVWKTLVKPNDNIICVLCGHNGFAAKLFSMNDAGREVPQILFNLQFQENGGNGLVQLWEFPENTDVLNICAYDTINREWYMTDSTYVTFNYK